MAFHPSAGLAGIPVGIFLKLIPRGTRTSVSLRGHRHATPGQRVDRCAYPQGGRGGLSAVGWQGTASDPISLRHPPVALEVLPPGWARKRMALGAYPTVSRKHARDLLDAARAKLADGIDPVEARLQSRADQRKTVQLAGVRTRGNFDCPFQRCHLRSPQRCPRHLDQQFLSAPRPNAPYPALTKRDSSKSVSPCQRYATSGFPRPAL